MLTENDIETAITEISEAAEVGRRALAKKRHDIYKDGGKNFLIEQIRREFSEDAIKEMRLAPVNLLKKIVNKRSSIYKRPPVRQSENPSDQKLIEYYEKELKLNTLMQKVNRYFTLQANTSIYCRPMPFVEEGVVKSKLASSAVAPYLYSLLSDAAEKTKIQGYILNNFIESGMVTPQNNLSPATGIQSYAAEPGISTKGDKVASNETPADIQCRRFVFWTDTQHFTTNYKGEKILFEGMLEADPETLFLNPIGRMPLVNVAKDRDNEVWASEGEDMIDLTIAIQLGWSDLLTIAKHQGFGTLTAISEDEPKKLVVGVNRAIWLKATPNAPTPSLSYVQANSPLSEYKDLLMELLGLLLTTNDMEPSSISGKASGTQYTSGFHALIAMSDNLEAIELDKPAMLEAEKEHFQVIKAWHNYLFDYNALTDDARALGKFSDDFDLTVQFADVKPLESEDEKLDRIEKKTKLKLITRRDALKILNPDLNDKQLDAKLKQIDDELASLKDAMAASSPIPPKETPVGEKPLPPILDKQKLIANESDPADATPPDNAADQEEEA